MPQKKKKRTARFRYFVYVSSTEIGEFLFCHASYVCLGRTVIVLLTRRFLLAPTIVCAYCFNHGGVGRGRGRAGTVCCLRHVRSIVGRVQDDSGRPFQPANRVWKNKKIKTRKNRPFTFCASLKKKTTKRPFDCSVLPVTVVKYRPATTRTLDR